MAPIGWICLSISSLAAGKILVSGQVLPLPQPLAFWNFQEPTGSPRVSEGLHAYSLIDGNASVPIERVSGGVFGDYAAYFPASGSNNSQRLLVSRENAPAITSSIAGENATVSLVAWVYRNSTDITGGGNYIGGVWNEHAAARQYAIFIKLAVCETAPVFADGLVAHISPVGGPTPGSRYCETAACDTPALPADGWHCLATVYNSTHIMGYTNGTLHLNGFANPFALTGGIYSPEAADKPGAPFEVGANYINVTAGSPPVLANRFRGRLGGLAVFGEALLQSDVAAVCAWAAGF